MNIGGFLILNKITYRHEIIIYNYYRVFLIIIDNFLKVLKVIFSYF